VSDAHQISVLLAQADVQRRLGNHRGGIDLLRRALSLDPDHPRAHAALAHHLLDARRLPAAGVEVRTALGLDGNDPFIHQVAAAVLTAERKLDDAWAHCLIAMQDPAAPPEAFVLGARIRQLLGDIAGARELVREALARDAAHTGALTRLAWLEFDAGLYEAAARAAQAALEADPISRDAHIVAGYIDLARGDTTAAEHHARFVLRHDPSDAGGGLALWTAVQARRSFVLGTWWRFNVWLTRGELGRRIGRLMAFYLLARVAIIVTDELGFERLSLAIGLAWLALCAYTWIAPRVFQGMLKRSLTPVTLDPDF
jgi:tetratricopeptide (TPR) repeat protein